MDSGGRSALREDATLTKLKGKIGVPPNIAQYDQYLLRFLRNKNLDVDQTVAKLARRREYEKTLPLLSVSEETVSALRSKAFCMIMSDVMRRPVLYIRMGLHRFSDSAADETLTIVILEYMQYVVHQQNVSEFVVLINEENTGWMATKNAMQEQIVEILQKYYPDMLGQVLIVNANWVVAQGVKSTVASQSKLKSRTKILRTRELQRFFDLAVVPQELGGSNNVSGTAVDFAEHCLRYWYNMMMLIQHEMAIGGGALRTLWQPICGIMQGIVGSMLLEKRNAYLHTKEGARAGQASPASLTRGGKKGHSHGPGGVTSPPDSAQRSAQSFTSGFVADDTTDDGCCSVISEQDLDQLAWDQAKKPLGADEENTGGEFDGNTAVTPPPGGFSPQEGSTDAALRQQLSIEMQRRKELENKVAALELGAPISTHNLGRVEGTLRSHHEEMNTLIGEVIIKAKGKHRGDPSLLALLDQTNSALMQVTQEKPTVPAMKNSAPIDRKPEASCTIS